MIEVNIKEYRHKGQKELFFENQSFKINGNGLFLFTGESGVGKSTLMKLILGLHSGIVDGDIIYTLDSRQIQIDQLRKTGKISYQPDSFALVPWLNIKDNLLIPNQLNNSLEIPDDRQINHSLTKVGLQSETLKLYPDELSFGMKARVGLLRAILTDAKFIFLDELFSGIDSLNIKGIVEILDDFKKNHLIIAISHQVEKVIDIVDELYIITNQRDILKTDKTSFL